MNVHIAQLRDFYPCVLYLNWDRYQIPYLYYSLAPTIDFESKTFHCISECKTGSIGYNLRYSEYCSRVEIHTCSSNNWNCPNGQASQEQKWIMARNFALIEGCAYYHCIFTLSFELNGRINENQKLLYNFMLACLSDNLLTLCKKQMCATSRIIMYYTHLRHKLDFQPHIHCVSSGGKLIESGQFTKFYKKSYLVCDLVVIRATDIKQ